MNPSVKYGVRWFVGDGEHDYKESGFCESATLGGLFARMQLEVPEELLFDALSEGRQEHIYWVTDDFGFELYRPTQPWPREPAAG